MFNILDPSIKKGLRLSHCSDEVFEGDEVMEPVSTIDLRELTISTTKACSYCQTEFEDTSQQRAHFKSDWHRFNLKQSLISRAPVSEEEFFKQADDVSSISGSESDSSDDSADDETREGRRMLCFRGAKFFFENDAGQSFSLYKTLLVARREEISAPVLLDRLISFLDAPKKWLIVMLGGGHFAAAVFENSTMIVHKTFHCYTVRAKQGGSQASKDSKGGNHPKSAGASLRRYNELALVQHVQDIMSSWSEHIAKCSLIIYRAVGPHNHSVLFGGPESPLDKADSRLRSIPFTTRRATLKEVKRVYDMLSTLQYHGSASELAKQFTSENSSKSADSSSKHSPIKKQVDQHFDSFKKKASPLKTDRAKERSPKERELPGAKLTHSSDSSCDDGEMILGDQEIDLAGDLKEFHDTLKKKKKRKKLTAKQKTNIAKNKVAEETEKLTKKLVKLCQKGDNAGLEEAITVAETWLAKEEVVEETSTIPTQLLTKDDFNNILVGVVCESSGDTLLHVAAAHHHPAVVNILLNAGCDPCVKNKKNQVPYLLSGDKPTKTAFKDFSALHPGQYDPKETCIPEPLSEEQLQEKDEKKRARNKQRKMNEKLKKKEQYERKVDEDDKVRFLALSDREKRAFAAEKRIATAATAHLPTATAPVFIRCFQCGVNITGKVPFEYNTHVFCTIDCLKAHRAKKK